MKTTIDIPEPILRKVSDIAAAQGLTLKEIVTVALQEIIRVASKSRKNFKLEDRSVGGGWLSDHLVGAPWEEIRALSERALAPVGDNDPNPGKETM